jgi:hypothetical protein
LIILNSNRMQEPSPFLLHIHEPDYLLENLA